MPARLISPPSRATRSSRRPMDNLWKDVVDTQLYLTGGIGATGEGERFGHRYELPNITAYNETCAGIALCFWAHRMFLLHGDAKYIDVLERTLYNNVLAGVALDGREFFYPNPLASKGDYARSKWFPCACCPTNICRLIPSVPGYAYGTRGNELFVNLFVAGYGRYRAGRRQRFALRRKRITRGTASSKSRLNHSQAGQKFALRVRIPGWAKNQVVPSDLYSFLDKPPSEKPQLKLNGQSIDATPNSAGYAVIEEREWQPGDM